MSRIKESIRERNKQTVHVDCDECIRSFQRENSESNTFISASSESELLNANWSKMNNATFPFIEYEYPVLEEIDIYSNNRLPIFE
jgi:hypothetical protein